MIKRLKHLTHTAKTHQGFRRYFANTSWMFAEQMLRMVAGLFVGIWVARYLGPEQFGVFSYAIAFTAIFAGVAKLGLDGVVVRDLVICPENSKIYMGVTFWLKCFGGFFTFLLVLIATLITKNSAETDLYILIIASGLVFQGFEVVDFYFQSKVLVKFVSICKILQLVLSSIIKVYLILVKSELISFVWVSLFDQLFLAISLYLAYRFQRTENFYKVFDFIIAKKLLKDSWPLIFSGLAIMIYMRIDQVMLGQMLGDESVGIYSAAVRLSEAWYFMPLSIVVSVFPSIIEAKKQNEELYYRRLQKLYDLIIFLAFMVALPVCLYADWIIQIIYGVAYKGAGDVLAIHVWVGVFAALNVASGKWFLTEGYTLLALKRNLYGAVLNIAFNIILIPQMGLRGAAFATLVSYAISAYFSDVMSTKTRMMFYQKTKAFLLIFLTMYRYIFLRNRKL